MDKLRVVPGAIVLLSILTTGCSLPIKTHEAVLDGVANFENSQWGQSLTELKGRWHIIQGPASYDEALELVSGMPKGLIEVPSYWEGQVIDSQSTPLPNNGDAYLALELELSRDRPELAVYVESAGSAHTLSLYDGERLVDRVESGRVGEFKDQEIPWWRPRILRIPYDTRRPVLVWHISNFHHSRGGPWTTPLIGSYTSVLEHQTRSGHRDFFVFGLLAMMAFYHFILYLERPEDKGSGWFGALCALFAIRTLLTGRLLETYFEGYASISLYEWFIRVEYWTFCLAPATFVLFIGKIVAQPWFKRVERFCAAICLLYAVVILLTSPDTFTGFLVTWQVLTALFITLIFGALTVDALYGRSLAKWSLGALAVFVIAIVHDIFKSHLNWSSPFVLTYGFASFVAIQSLILARRVSTAYRTSERLTRHLRSEVQKRTSQLEAQTDASIRARAEAETLRSQAEAQAAQLRELDQQKTRFFQNVSHELRTPLTLMMGPLDRLAHETQSEELAVASRQSRRLFRLVNQLLDFQKAAAGAQSLEREPIDVRSFVDACRESFALTCRERSLALSCNVDIPDERELLFDADPDALEKMASNYLINAVKHTPGGGQIHLEVRQKDDGFLRLSVTDTGDGVPENEREQLFNPFTKVSSSRGTSDPSTGLGLALVRELVELHGGRVGMTENPDGGSIFWLDLPRWSSEQDRGEEGEAITGTRFFKLAELERAAKERAEVEKENQDSHQENPQATTIEIHKGLVVVAEDNPDLRRYISRLLNDCGWEVKAFEHGAQALNFFQDNRADILVTDWMMPEVTGPELIVALRESESHANMPIVMMTARTEGDSRPDALEAGATIYISKPFDEREFRSVIDNLHSLIEANRRERDHLEAMLSQQESLAGLGQLMASVAHELRNPIHTFGMMLELCQDELNLLKSSMQRIPLDQMPTPVLDKITGSIEELDGYIRDMNLPLTKSSELVSALRTQARREEAATPEVNIRELVDESLAIAGGRLKRVQVIVDIPVGLTHHCFRAKVGQIIVNLVGNASDALEQETNKAPTIRIHAQRMSSTSSLILRVSDNGPGIPKEIQSKVFDKFFTTKDAGQGTGLGLAMCHEWATQWGGGLSLTSSELGGATFKLELPVLDLDA